MKCGSRTAPRRVLPVAVAAMAAVLVGILPMRSWDRPSEILGSPWKRLDLDPEGRGADGVRRVENASTLSRHILVPWEEEGVVRLCDLSNRDGAASCSDLVGLAGAEEAVAFELPFGQIGGFVGADSSSGGPARLLGFRADDRGSWKLLETRVLAERAEGAWLTLLLVPSRQGVHGLLGGGRFQDLGLVWMEFSPDPREEFFAFQEIWTSPGWLMELQLLRWDPERFSILLSQRLGVRAGLWLLDLASPKKGSPYPTRAIRLRKGGGEPMMADAILEENGEYAIALAERKRGVFLARFDLDGGRILESCELPIPVPAGRPKAVRWADLDLDGDLDLVVTSEDAFRPKRGVYWWKAVGEGLCDRIPYDISGPAGVKFDRIEALDLDWDGDIDILTTEEKRLGFVAFLNPARDT